MPQRTAQHKTTFHVYTTHHLFRKTKEIIDDILDKNPQVRTVLDVPAGSGALAHYIETEHEKTVRACDIDHKKWSYKKIKLDVADLGRKIPYGNGKFDLTVCLEGLKHVTDLATAVNELSRVTKPGGYVVITIPNDLNMQNRVRFVGDGFVDCDWRLIDYESPDVENFLYVQSIVHLPYLYFHLERNGLKIIGTYASRLRVLSIFLAVVLYPVIYLRTAKACGRKHPLFRHLISMIWLSGRHNIIVCSKEGT